MSAIDHGFSYCGDIDEDLQIDRVYRHIQTQWLDYKEILKHEKARMV